MTMKISPLVKAVPPLLLLALAIAIPFLFTSYHVFQFTMAMVWLNAIIGLNIVTGASGQLSLAQAAFVGIGAYTSGLLVNAGVPWIATVPISAMGCGLVGFLVGIPCLRVKGLYLALVTMALALMIGPLLKRFEGITGGAQGLSVPPLDVPTWTGLESDQWLYLVVLTVTTVCFVVGRALLLSRTGRVLQAVKDNETAAEVAGVNLFLKKTGAFAWSAVYAGVAGSLYAVTVGLLTPESFNLLLGVNLLAALVLGGVASIWGPIVGALFLQFVPVYAGDVHEALATVIFGATLIGWMLVMPSGVAGLGRRLLQTLPAHRDRAEPAKAGLQLIGR